MSLAAIFVATLASTSLTFAAQPVQSPPSLPPSVQPSQTPASPEPVAPQTSATPALPAASPSPSPSPSAAPLALGKTRLQLNRNANATIPISGGVPPLRATLSSPIADAQIDAAGTTLGLRGLVDGTATLTISDATGASLTATVLVGPNASFVPSDVDVALTGNPTADFATAQIRAAIVRAAQPLPGASLVVGDATLPPALAPGIRIDAPVRVHADGANRYVDVDGFSNVHVTVAPATAVVPTVLFYSDDPENVRADGVLFRGTLTARTPVRLYYYHQAATPQRQIAIVLDAPAGSAQVTILGRGAGPNAAVMYVGQSATFRYLDDRSRGAGVNLDVPVGAPLEIFTGDRALGRGDLVAGALDFSIRSGDPVRLTVLSLSPGADVRALLGDDELPSDGRGRRGEYDLATPLPISLAYTIGGAEPPSVSVGSAPIPNLRSGGRALAGDYGVVRPVDLSLTNPTAAPQVVYFYELPIGYPVTTTIAFDGDAAPMRLQCAKNRNRYLVRAFTLPANGNAMVTGSYMTDGGSTYPLTFGLTATPPLPLPATMTEADGCYPKPAGAPSASPASPSPAASPSPTAPAVSPAVPIPAAT